MSKHQVVYYKYTPFLFVKYISVKLKKKKDFNSTVKILFLLREEQSHYEFDALGLNAIYCINITCTQLEIMIRFSKL